MYDVIVIGSGASAVHVSYPLVESGFKVGMIDVGIEDRRYEAMIPDRSFSEIRKTDSEQHRYFLGEDFEGIPSGRLAVGPQLTPPRQHIIRDAGRFAPFRSGSFMPYASLALGGLASGWGAGAMGYGRRELEGFPLSYETLQPHYEIIAGRIGVSGERDDLYPFDGELSNLLPPLRIDRNARCLLDRYGKKKQKLNAAGLFLGKLRAAALSREFRGRGPDRYRDMSFWSDSDHSVWRPRYTLEELRKRENFTYVHPYLAERFTEEGEGSVRLVTRNLGNGEKKIFTARKLLVAAGVLGTARLVLRSMEAYGEKLPFVCNPYTYYPMIRITGAGKEPQDGVHSLAQLCGVYLPPGPDEPMIHLRIHSYRSLLNFKVIKEIPLPFKEGLQLMKLIQPGLIIVALDHEDRPSPDKYLRLHRGAEGARDELEIVYSVDPELRRKQRAHERRVIRLLRSLGCIALKRVWPGDGASLHYGGTFPMSMAGEKGTVDLNGRLRGMHSVYLCDGSVFPFLPAKGLTFTMMASANRIGTLLAKDLHGRV